MKKESEVTDTVSTENPRLSEAQSRFLKHWELYSQFRRKSVGEAWHCGNALREVREEAKHGEWGKSLKSLDISQSTADRLIRLSKNYDDVTQLGEFTSVNQALKAMAPARPRRKEPAKEVEPDVETKGEAPSVEKEEVTDSNGPPQRPVDIESTEGIKQLRDKLRETKDQLSQAKKEVADLRQEKERLKRLLKQNGIPWESAPDDQQKVYLLTA